MATDVRRHHEVRRIGFAMLPTLHLHPHRGWRHVAAAPASVAGIIIGLAMPLAAVRAIAVLVHDLAFGRGSMGIIQYRPTMAGAIGAAVAGWLLSLVAMALLAFAITALAARFGGRPDRVAAFKIAVAGSSTFFLAGVFAVAPVMGALQILGLYSLFLIAIGAPRLMHVPDERGLGFGGTVIAAAAVLAVALLALTGTIGQRSVRATVATADGRQVVSGSPVIATATLTAPANDKKRAVAPGTIAGADRTVPASSLQALLPASLGAFQRTATESQSNMSAGITSAAAKGTYVEGTNSFTLTVTDAGQPGALATNDSVIAGEIDRQTDTGYQRSRVVNGVRVSEKWSNADHGGSYSRTVAGRFTVEAQGTAPSIAVLRGAVASVDAGRLAALARL